MYIPNLVRAHQSTHIDDGSDEINEGLDTLCLRIGTGTRPEAAHPGRMWFEATKISRDTGSAWEELAGGGSGKPPVTKIVAAFDAISTSGANYVCDGVDDQTQINSAITALGSTGGIVQLTEGTYLLSDSVLISSKVILQGCGPNTVVKIKNGNSASFGVIENKNQDATGNTSIVIRNLKIDGNKAGSSGTNDGIAFYNVDKFIIYNVVGADMRQDGVSLQTAASNACSNGRIVHCILSSPTRYGVYSDQSTYLTVIDNQILSAARGVVLSQGGPYIVTGNEFDACTSYGVEVYRANQSSISYNIFNGGSACHAIHVYANVGEEIDYCTIGANAIKSCLYGVEVAYFNYGTIQGNDISLVTNGIGISVSAAIACALKSNHIIGTTGSVGMSVSTLLDSSIFGNTVRSNGGGWDKPDRM